MAKLRLREISSILIKKEYTKQQTLVSIQNGLGPIYHSSCKSILSKNPLTEFQL